MIIYLLLTGFDSVLSLLVSIIPSFDVPSWFTNELPEALSKIASWNNYLPISETIAVIVFLLTFTLTYKIIKIILNLAHIDLNS